MTTEEWKVSSPDVSSYSGEYMYYVHGPETVADYDTWGYTKKSATLIACAPKLLAALKLLESANRGQDNIQLALFEARKAIKEAEGEA